MLPAAMTCGCFCSHKCISDGGYGYSPWRLTQIGLCDHVCMRVRQGYVETREVKIASLCVLGCGEVSPLTRLFPATGQEALLCSLRGEVVMRPLLQAGLLFSEPGFAVVFQLAL